MVLNTQTDARLLDAKYEWSARITIGSVVVVREGHSGRGAGQDIGAVLGIEHMMLSRKEGWWLGVVWSMWVSEGTENTSYKRRNER